MASSFLTLYRFLDAHPFRQKVPTALVVLALGLFSLPHLSQAIVHLQPLRGGFGQTWTGFVSIVLALSGKFFLSWPGLMANR